MSVFVGAVVVSSYTGVAVAVVVEIATVVVDRAMMAIAWMAAANTVAAEACCY
jgi:hypothetical protein